MICKPCKTGGQLNTEANIATARGGYVASAIEELARQRHNDCPGGNWCDCHHFVGQALNITLITETQEVLSAAGAD